jgi:hypothetical protein
MAAVVAAATAVAVVAATAAAEAAVVPTAVEAASRKAAGATSARRNADSEMGLLREALVFWVLIRKGVSPQRHKGHEEISLCSLCLCGEKAFLTPLPQANGSSFVR